MGLQSKKRQFVAGSIQHAEIAPNIPASSLAANIPASSLEEGVIRVANATLTSEQILSLFATPVSILPAPGAGKANILLGALLHKPAGTAYAGIGATENLVIKYTNASGLTLATIEPDGFMDQVTAQTRYVHPPTTTDITPVANAAMVAHILVGEWSTGDTSLLFRLFYRTVPTVLT